MRLPAKRGVAFTLSRRTVALSLPETDGVALSLPQAGSRERKFRQGRRHPQRPHGGGPSHLNRHGPGCRRPAVPRRREMPYHAHAPPIPAGATKETKHEKRKEAHGRRQEVPHRVRPRGRRVGEDDREGGRREPLDGLPRDPEAHLRVLQGLLRQGEPVRPPAGVRPNGRLRRPPREGRAVRAVQLPQLQQAVRGLRVRRLREARPADRAGLQRLPRREAVPRPQALLRRLARAGGLPQGPERAPPGRRGSATTSTTSYRRGSGRVSPSTTSASPTPRR